MTSWQTIKENPELKAKHYNYMKEYNKNKYDTDPVYREYMKDKARKRKAMLREQKT
tara:strand:- start:44 stop:211 length:168 start_codon:yes stop_codon:yes gene_type:complete